jgi:hypothetical protein
MIHLPPLSGTKLQNSESPTVISEGIRGGFLFDVSHPQVSSGFYFYSVSIVRGVPKIGDFSGLFGENLQETGLATAVVTDQADLGTSS